MSLEFRIEEWMSAEGVTSDELRTTWARLRIFADGQLVSEARDDSAQTTRNALYLPAYPLAEWVVSNWFSLLNETEAPGRGTGHGYWRRHCVRAAGEGFALPELLIVPEGKTASLRWEPKELPEMKLRFVSRGEARIQRISLEQSLRNLVEVVLARMREAGIPQGTFLDQEWNAILALDHEEVSFCNAVSSMGIDPFTVDDALTERVLRIGNALPLNLHGEFFAAATPPDLDDQLRWIQNAIELGESSDTLEQVPPLRKEYERNWTGSQSNAHAPWELGYQAAGIVRRYLGLSNDPLSPLDMDERLGFASKRTLPPAAHSNLDAMVVSGPRGGSVVLPDDRSGTASRFAFARALYEAVAFSDSNALVTRAGSIRQKINRAFAAELLAPAEGLRARMPKGIPSQETIEDLADLFRVSSETIRFQVLNHRIAPLPA